MGLDGAVAEGAGAFYRILGGYLDIPPWIYYFSGDFGFCSDEPMEKCAGGKFL